MIELKKLYMILNLYFCKPSKQKHPQGDSTISWLDYYRPPY